MLVVDYSQGQVSVDLVLIDRVSPRQVGFPSLFLEKMQLFQTAKRTEQVLKTSLQIEMRSTTAFYDVDFRDDVCKVTLVCENALLPLSSVLLMEIADALVPVDS